MEPAKRLTAVQLLDAALETEAGGPPGSEALRQQVLARLLARWLLARSDAPEIDVLRVCSQARTLITKPERFL